MTNPVGKVDMKIGSDCSELLTKVVKAVGSLQLLESQFGYCIRGRLTSVDSHRDYTKSGCKLNHISIDSSTSEISVSEMPDLKMSLYGVLWVDPDLNDETCL